MPSPLTLPARYAGHQPPAGTPLRRGHPLAPDLGCWVFNAGAGRAMRNLVTGVVADAAWATASGGGAWGPARAGRAVRSAGSPNAAGGGLVRLAADSSTVLPTVAVTIVLGYHKLDATARQAEALGVDDLNFNARCGVQLPWSDGVASFDFGGTSSPNRVSAAGLTFGDDIWAFTVGPRGQEIWQDGLLRATGAAGGTRSQSTGAYALGCNGGYSWDYAAWTFVYIYRRQLPTAAIVGLARAPYQCF